MQRLLAALITALLNGRLTTRIEHNLSIMESTIAGELGNSIIGREKSIISSCLMQAVQPTVVNGLTVDHTSAWCLL